MVRALVGNGARDALADPPSRVSRKFIATAPVKFLDRSHQANVTFLDQVEKWQPTVHVALRNRYDQPQVGLRQFLLRLLGFGLTFRNELKRSLQLNDADLACFVDPYRAVAAGTRPFALLTVKRERFLTGRPEHLEKAFSLRKRKVDRPHQFRHFDPRPREPNFARR